MGWDDGIKMVSPLAVKIIVARCRTGRLTDQSDRPTYVFLVYCTLFLLFAIHRIGHKPQEVFVPECNQGKSKMEEGRINKQEARSKKQEVRSKKQEARSTKRKRVL